MTSISTNISGRGGELNVREAQARTVREVFETAGYEPVATPTLQPAEVFLDRHGEDIRRRTYLFNDPGGKELCLRPDLTIPVCRLYLDRDPKAAQLARLCASGTVYRYQPAGSTKLNEYNQCGLELLGQTDELEADAEVTRLALAAVTQAGVRGFEIELGDISLFNALIEALSIPHGWKQRLKRQFWRPDAFTEQLNGLAKGDAGSSEITQGGLLAVLAGLGEDKAKALLSDVMTLGGIPPVGGRSIEEITARLLEKARDATVKPMPGEAAGLIAAFMEVSCPAEEAVARVRKVVKAGSIDIDDALDRLEARLAVLKKAGVDLSTATFSTGFGRTLEYYTGHVFEIRVRALGDEAVIAGGGRYDRLLQTLGAAGSVPAVGCAVTLERLFLARNLNIDRAGEKK